MKKTVKKSMKSAPKVVKVQKVGSKSFLRSVAKGYAVLITTKGWIYYLAETSNRNAEQWRLTVSEKDQKIQRLEKVVDTATEKLLKMEFERDELGKGNTAQLGHIQELSKRHKELLGRTLRLKKLLGVVLMPWVQYMGPVRLRSFIFRLFSALGSPFSQEINQTVNEVVVEVCVENGRLLTSELDVDAAPPSLLSKVVGEFLDHWKKFVNPM